MPKKKQGRGRPKGSIKGSPHNLAWWKWTLVKPEEVTAFIERGNEQQRANMKCILKHLRVNEPEFFEKINGKEIVRRLK